MDKAPLVSVWMITYNHESFIEQAIESVLMQKTDFEFELVIGEDCSTDSTREIVLRYKEKYPGKIRLVLQETNVGVARNFLDTLKACTGKYVALVEGDDYWTDAYKLQKQVDFLEAHDDYAICTHAADRVNDRNEKNGVWFEPPESKEFYTLEDFISYGRTFIATASMVARNYRGRMPEWFTKAPAGDMAFIMGTCLQEDGKIKRLSDFMSVHRAHEGGVYSGLSYLNQLMFSIEARIFFRRMLPAKYEPAFEKGLKTIISDNLSSVAGLTQSNSELKNKNRQLVSEINRLAEEARKSKDPVIALYASLEAAAPRAADKVLPLM